MNLIKSILLTIVMVGLHFSLGAFAYYIFPKTSLNSFHNLSNSIALLVIDIIIIVIVVFYLNKTKTLKKLKAEFRNSNLKDFIIGIVFGVITVVLLTHSTQIYRTIFQLGEYEFRSGHLSLKLFHLLDIIAFVLIGPIFEELVFRGYIQNKLQNKFNLYFAVVISSLLFGLYHVPEGLQIWTSTIFSIPIALIYAKRKKIIIPIMWHITWNGLIVFSKYVEIW